MVITAAILPGKRAWPHQFSRLPGVVFYASALAHVVRQAGVLLLWVSTLRRKFFLLSLEIVSPQKTLSIKTRG